VKAQKAAILVEATSGGTNMRSHSPSVRLASVLSSGPSRHLGFYTGRILKSGKPADDLDDNPLNKAPEIIRRRRKRVDEAIVH
jgi:hypothetical protein